MSIVVVGSVAYDDVETLKGKSLNQLGGSASYFAVSANYFTDIKLVACVGKDFHDNDINIFKNKKIDITGLEILDGETFRWGGTYLTESGQAKTLYTKLNVFERFNPKLPNNYCDCEYVFLANIDPDLQLKVLNQIKNPKLIVCDSRRLWIDNKLESLKSVLKKVDVFLLNDEEAFSLTKKNNINESINMIFKMGPKTIILKQGEKGSTIYTNNKSFYVPTCENINVFDTTGAGDTFAGGFMGHIAKTKKIDFENMKEALMWGTVMASFGIEAFGLNGIINLKFEDINKRYLEFCKKV